MTDFISPLLEWLNANPQLAGLVTFIISAAESVAIIGTVVPGSIMMTALGTLAGAGVIPLWETIIWAILGAIVGDGISYWMGRYFKDRLPLMWPFRNYPYLLSSGEKFFYKYGGMSVFIGRFVGPVRALVPLVAGMLGMKPLQFIAANVASAVLWAPAYMLPGILLGAASLELPPEIAIHVIVVLLLISLFIMLCLWFVYKLLRLIHSQIHQMENKIWLALQRSSVLSPTTRLLKHHDPEKTHGQLNLALFFVLTVCLLIALCAYAKWEGPASIGINDILFHLFRGIRHPVVENIMINITMLGEKVILLPVLAIIFLWLMAIKRWRAGLHVLALGALTAGGVFVIKHLIHTPRPWGIAIPPTSFSMPSGHATMSTMFFMGLALLLASKMPQKNRWTVYTLATLLILFIGSSRLYLGAHWFTDVLAGWLLGASILMLIIISYQREKEMSLGIIPIVLFGALTFTITYTSYHYFHYSSMQQAYRKLDWPIVAINPAEWWENNRALESYHVSLFGIPSEVINVEWAGNIDQIRRSLLKQGWGKPPVRDFISTLHRLTDVSSNEYLPLVSPQYMDKKPALILTRRMNGDRSLLVLRIWDSHRVFEQSNTTLWVGIVGVVPSSYNWLFRHVPAVSLIDSTLLFPSQQQSAWEWKMLTMPYPDKPQAKKYHLLLIRKK